MSELPFLQTLLQRIGARRVLDTACGTGKHAIALAQAGYEVVGTDLSQGMIDRARINAKEAGGRVQFETAGFGHIRNSAGTGFDAVLCLGNSLPHVLTPGDLEETLLDFASCLRPGGILLIQNLNFDKILTGKNRWMEPKSVMDGDSERLFLRFYDFDPQGLVTFNVIQIKRIKGGRWQQEVLSTSLRPMTKVILIEALERVGFVDVQCSGDLQGQPFDKDNSGNLLISAFAGSTL